MKRSNNAAWALKSPLPSVKRSWTSWMHPSKGLARLLYRCLSAWRRPTCRRSMMLWQPPSARLHELFNGRTVRVKAALWYEKEDIRIEEVPEPSAGAGEVKLRIKACGICGSDLHEYRSG